jgi:CheY-like chemotaxis protein
VVIVATSLAGPLLAVVEFERTRSLKDEQREWRHTFPPPADSEMATRSRSSQHKLQGKHILVVEDHDLMAKLLVDVLRNYDHASSARSGKQALQEIRRQPPSIILLDLTLPDMSGLEVVKRVRQKKKTKSIPILAMSASPDEKDKCLEAGCNSFILKPFDIKELLKEINALLPT